MTAFRSSIAVLALLALTVSALAQEDKPAEKQQKDIYDETADARDQIDKALVSAKKENRRVLVQWGANWCGACKLMHGRFEKDRALARKLMYEYDWVLVDVGQYDRHMDLAKKYGAEIKEAGLPYLTLLNADGEVIINQGTGPFWNQVDGGWQLDAEKMLAFLEKHQAPYLPAESLLADGLAKAKAEDKRVYVHFGAPWCGWCKRLEAWLAKKEVAEVLGRHFVDVKIDIDRTIEGAAMLHELAQSKRSGIPWSAVLDEGGAVAAPSYMGERQNIGYPVSDAEIEAFIEMLATGAPSLTDKEQAFLAESLRESRPKGH